MPRYIGRAVLGLLFPAALLAQAPATAPGQPPAPARTSSSPTTSSIRGRILAADTGRAVWGARVRLVASELPAPRVVGTDVGGRYEIAGLPAGRYILTASKSGFLELSYGQTRPFESGKPIVLAVGQTVENIDVRLPRAGAINGRVTDESGYPLINALVIVMRAQFRRGIRQLVSVAAGPTDDRGEFRIAGLSPGAFYVSAVKTFVIGAGGSIDFETGYARTFFPGTWNPADARPVTVKLGQTSSAGTLALASRASSITGTVADADGRPFRASVNVRVAGIDPTASAVVDPKGNFKVEGLGPGEYTLRAIESVPPGAGVRAPTLDPQVAVARIVLTGESVAGVRLNAVRLPDATGRIVLDPLATATVPVSSINIGTTPADPLDVAWYTTTVSPAEDMRFTLNAPPGRMLVRPTLPRGWVLRAVRLKGDDVTDAGIEFRAGESVRDIEIELTNRLTTVTGSARGLKGESLTDYTVLLFARDPERWKSDGRWFALARPDQKGTFSVTGLAPGDYFAAILEYLDPGEAQNPDLLDRLRRNAASLTLREGEPASIELRMAP